MQQMGSLPGLGWSLGGGNVNPLWYSWEIPWTEDPGGLLSMESDMTQQLNTDEPIIRSRARRQIATWKNYIQFIIQTYIICNHANAQLLQSCLTPCTAAHQAPLSVGFSRQEYWSGLPCPPPGNCLNPRINFASPMSSVLLVDSLPLNHWGCP